MADLKLGERTASGFPEPPVVRTALTVPPGCRVVWLGPLSDFCKSGSEPSNLLSELQRRSSEIEAGLREEEAPPDNYGT